MSNNVPQTMKAVADYLNKQNRPYSAVDIHTNLHKEYGKTAVVKALETLATEGKIKQKDYGKQKVFVADQEQFPSMDENELKGMDEKITTMSEKIKARQGELKQREHLLSKLSSSLTTKEAEDKLTALKEECAKLSAKADFLKNGENAVSPEDRAAIVKLHGGSVKEWRKRKRMAMDILDAILEGYPKSKKELFEEVGVETDEDVGVKIPDS